MRDEKGQFVKGYMPWNRNKKTGIHPKTEFKKGQSPTKGSFKKGHHSRTEFKKGHSPIAPFQKGNHPRTEWKKGIYQGCGFKKGDKAWNKNITGKDSHAYINGKSFEPYSPEFNKELKRKIKERDNYTCQLCEMTEKEQKRLDSLKRGLTIHHITYDKKNYEEDKLITLCRKCNAMANFNRKDWTNYFNNLIKLKS